MKVGQLFPVYDLGDGLAVFADVIGKEGRFGVCPGNAPIDQRDADLAGMFFPEEMFERLYIDIGDLVFRAGAEEFGEV